MRVIAGTAGGRRLKAPPGCGTRPTADRVREAMFSSIGDEIDGADVLDLFAGSGALGIEALSRGARWATFVERDERAAAVVRDNLAAAGLSERATVVRGDAAAFVSRSAGRRYAVVFCDPPYDTSLAAVTALVEQLHAGDALAPGGLVVVERDRRDPQLGGGLPSQLLAVDRQRSYGDTVLLYLRAKDR